MSTAKKTDMSLLQEANNWLTVEHWVGGNRSAKRVIAALRSGTDCDDLAVAWLRIVARTTNRRAMLAATILRQLQADGQIRGAR